LSFRPVDIAGLPKGAVLAALFNAADPQGRGVLRANPSGMSAEVGQAIYDADGPDFDYLNGRPLKVNLGGDTFDPRLYDRDNGGDGAAEAIVALLRGVEP